MKNTAVARFVADQRTSIAQDWMQLAYDQLQQCREAIGSNRSLASVVLGSAQAVGYAQLGRLAYEGTPTPGISAIVGRPMDMGEQEAGFVLHQEIGKSDFLASRELASFMPSSIYSHEEAEAVFASAVKMVASLAREVSPDLDLDEFLRSRQHNHPTPFPQQV